MPRRNFRNSLRPPVEEIVHGSTMSHNDRLRYVRNTSMEKLWDGDEYENALLKEMDSRSEHFNRVSRLNSRMERINELVLITKECFVESGFVKIGSALWVGNNGYYRPVVSRYAYDVIFRTLLFMGVGATEADKVCYPSVRAMEDMTANIRHDVIRFSNCFYVFGKGVKTVLNHGICIYGVPWKYKRKVKSPLFDAFICKILPDIRDRRCVQEFFGLTYVDRSRVSVEKFLMMIGNGANGKSVLLNIVSAVIGEYYISHLDPSQLRDYRQIAAMDGKRINIASDVKSSAVLSSAMKTLISGEKVEAWKIYEGTRNILCPPLVFSMNEMPRTEDTTNGMIRRMLPVFFGVTIPEEEQDKELAAKIIANELPAVFDWMMEGRSRLLENGGKFTQSIKSMSLSTDIIRKSVPILDMLEASGLHREPRYVGQEPVYMRAKDIVERFDLSLSTSSNKIARDLRDAGFNMKTIHGYANFILYTDEN